MFTFHYDLRHRAFMFRNGFFSYCLPPIKYIVYLLAFCAAQINWEINAAQESKS